MGRFTPEPPQAFTISQTAATACVGVITKSGLQSLAVFTLVSFLHEIQHFVKCTFTSHGVRSSHFVQQL